MGKGDVISGAATTGPANDPGRYEVVERIASSSGQGVVFKAILRSRLSTLGTWVSPGTFVALKQVGAGTLGVHRLEELHEAVARRRHPALGHQLEVFRGRSIPEPDPESDPESAARDGDVLFVAAAWVEGTTLLTSARKASVQELLSWTRQVAEALDLLHADLYGNGSLLHRDVKPSNIIVTPDGRAVLIDPGLARIGPPWGTITRYGTPGYVPPECDADPTGSPAADGWQLAATLVKALTGDVPDGHGTTEAMRAAIVQRCRKQVTQPDVFADVVLSMLADDPEDRPPSAAAWTASLHAATSAPAPRPRRRTTSLTRGRLGLLGLVVGVVVGVAARAVLPPLDRSGSGGDRAAPTVEETESAEPDDEETDSSGPDDEITSGPGFTLPALVDTRRVSGAHIDDRQEAYLSTDPFRYCRALDCEVPDSTVSSGTRVTLTCRINGQRVANGEELSPVDRANDIFFSSEVWYGVRLEDGTSGLLPEVWIHPDDRVALGLPRC